MDRCAAEESLNLDVFFSRTRTKLSEEFADMFTETAGIPPYCREPPKE